MPGCYSEVPSRPYQEARGCGRGGACRSAARHVVPGACLPTTAQDKRRPPLTATTHGDGLDPGCTPAVLGVIRAATISAHGQSPDLL